MDKIDARGLSCPEPVVRTMKGIEKSPAGVTVLVDAPVCVENISRFAASRGYKTEVKQNGGEYEITLSK